MNKDKEQPQQGSPVQPDDSANRKPSVGGGEVVVVLDADGNMYAIERYIMERTRVSEQHRRDIEQVLTGKDPSHGGFMLASAPASFRVAGVLRFEPSRAVNIANALRDL